MHKRVKEILKNYLWGRFTVKECEDALWHLYSTVGEISYIEYTNALDFFQTLYERKARKA